MKITRIICQILSNEKQMGQIVLFGIIIALLIWTACDNYPTEVATSRPFRVENKGTIRFNNNTVVSFVFDIYGGGPTYKISFDYDADGDHDDGKLTVTRRSDKEPFGIITPGVALVAIPSNVVRILIFDVSSSKDTTLTTQIRTTAPDAVLEINLGTEGFDFHYAPQNKPKRS